ncbi:hypothetical protein F0L68_28065 [Solihabitans fulvus]|uniref:PBP domain-containing protein n=1 Tax=Solihabitans fulvus TaxID=1892852 RepID=A0A5B2WUH0_9PSEU|nr:hypothetical protein [Solihabitans fulvus]KAA2255653.1 hypothetical protein F0L68_28065 [Solihabitans fulvus]
MRSTFKKTAVLVAGAATLVAILGGTAAADPSFTPASNDIVGVGSDTTEFVVNKLATDYNATAPADKLASWDATGTSPITTKSGASAITRPNGSSSGIAALKADSTHSIDFARSSRGPKSDGSESTLAFIEFARDTISYATATTSTVPTTLTTQALHDLYASNTGTTACSYTAFIPQAGSGTRSFFLASIGLTEGTLGTCATVSQEHDATPLIGNANAIAPFSVGRAVGKTGIKVNNVDDSAHPAGTANVIARVDPATAQTVTTGGVTAYDRGLFNVLRKSDAALDKYSNVFGSLGWVCTDPTALADVQANNFRLSADCGIDKN